MIQGNLLRRIKEVVIERKPLILPCSRSRPDGFLCHTADDLLEQGSHPVGVAGGVGAEGGDGGGGVGLVVVEAAGQAGELVGVVGQVDAAAVVDDPEPALDGPEKS